MAIYDFEGMFGDRFSTEQAINDAMFEEVISFGQLDRTKYAPMTASTYYQAAGGGTPLGSMLKQAHPMMKRQNLLDEIKKKYPDPRTPKELYDLAAELSTNGFGDLSMQIRQVAMEMEKNEATKAYQTSQLGKPSSDDLKKIGRRLEGSIMNTGLENDYLQIVAPDLVNYNKDDHDSVSVWREKRKGYLDDIRSLIQQFSDNKQVSGFTKQMIDEAVGDSGVLTEEFIAWIMTSGNATVASNLLDAMGRDNPYKDKDGDGSDDTPPLPASQTAADVGSVVTQSAGQTESTTSAKQESMAKTATTAIEKMKPAEQEELYKTLSQRKYSGTSTIMLEPYQEEILRQLTAIYGTQNVDAWWRQY